jgi:hypothetical protein
MLLVVALLVAGVGILIQFLTGVPGFPAVPPGPIILAAAAVLVAVIRWKWIPIPGLLVAGFISVGMLLTFNNHGQFTNAGAPGQLIGSWLQLLALAVSLISAVLAIVQAARRRPVA